MILIVHLAYYWHTRTKVSTEMEHRQTSTLPLLSPIREATNENSGDRPMQEPFLRDHVLTSTKRQGSGPAAAREIS